VVVEVVEIVKQKELVVQVVVELVVNLKVPHQLQL
jgi:hypothetical protein